MNIITLIFLCVVLGVAVFLGRWWLRLPIPRFTRNMLTGSVICIITGIVLTWNDNAWGAALLAAGGSLSGIESYVRRRKDNPAES